MKLSSRQAVDIGTCYAAAILVFLGGISGMVPSIYNWYVGWTVIFCLTIIMPAITFFYNTKRARFFSAIYFIFSHIVIALSLVFITGPNNPFNILLVIAMVVSYRALGRKAFVTSIITIVSAMVAANFFNKDIQEYERLSYITAGLFLSTVITICAMVIMRIINSEAKSRIELEKTRELEKQQYHKLKTLINSLNDAVVTVDGSGVITIQNAAAQSFFDTNQSLVGKKLQDILTLFTVKKEPINIAVLFTESQSVDRDDVVRVIDNNEELRLNLQVHPTAATYGEDMLPGFVVILRDITKQKTLEEEKEEFISVMSHELRTPIAIAEGGLSNMILLQDRGAEPAKLKAGAEEARKQIVSLSNIVNDLATLSRVESDEEVAPELVSVYDIVDDIKGRFASDIAARSLTFTLDMPIDLQPLMTVRLYLEEILRNITNNAVKYTREGGVTLRVVEQNGAVTFSVKDTGIGMSHSDQKRIFEKFYRSEDFHTRETGGTGLGLYIVDKLADKLHTTVELESKLGEGSTFSFTLHR